MIDLSLLPDGGVGWLDASGPNPQIVLSTRIRLARNLVGHPFGTRATDADRGAVLARISDAAAASARLRRTVTFHLDELDRADRQLLHELLFRLAREYETAVVIVTHNRQLAARADRILWLEDGRLSVVRSVDAIP